MTAYSSSQGESGSSAQPAGHPWTSRWSGGPPTDWDEIRARLRSYTDQRSRRADESVPPDKTPQAVAAAPAPRPPAASSPRRMPMGAPSVEDLDYASVFDLPFIRWWQVHNPLVVQRAVLLLCVMIAILLLLHAF